MLTSMNKPLWEELQKNGITEQLKRMIRTLHCINFLVQFHGPQANFLENYVDLS